LFFVRTEATNIICLIGVGRVYN